MNDFDHERLDVYVAAIDFVALVDQVVERAGICCFGSLRCSSRCPANRRIGLGLGHELGLGHDMRGCLSRESKIELG
jgi:hypothetical protein